MIESDVKTELVNLESRLDKRFDELIEVFGKFAGDVDDRFNKVDERFETIDKRFDKMDMHFIKIDQKLADHDEEFRKLNKNYDHLMNTIDGFIGRIDKYETELVARDYKIDRLERWIEQIALKSNIKLV